MPPTTRVSRGPAAPVDVAAAPVAVDLPKPGRRGRAHASAATAADLPAQAKQAGRDSRHVGPVTASGAASDSSAVTTRIAARTPPPSASAAFGIPAAEWMPLESYWDRRMKSQAEVNGTFFVALKDGVPHLQIPLILKGGNRITPEYFEKVVQPLDAALAAAGKPVETLMDATDYRPTAKDFSPTSVADWGEALKAEVERVFGNAGIPTEVIITYQDVPLSPFETRALAGEGLGTKDADKLQSAIMRDVLKVGRAKSFRDKETLTFLLAPYPNIIQPYAQTEDFNPAIGHPTSVVLHELVHYLFADTYEAYQDPMAPANAVMSDIGGHKTAAARGQTLELSPFERELVLNRIAAVAEKHKRPGLAELQAQLAVAEQADKALRARAKVGRLVADKQGTLSLELAGTKERQPLDPAAWSKLYELADRKSKLLLVYDDAGALVAINAKHEDPRIGWLKFFGTEVGLTSQYIDGMIKELLAKG